MSFRRLLASASLAVVCLACTPLVSHSEAVQARSFVAQANAGAYVFPPEYAPQSRVWLSWPTYENKAGWSSKEVQAEIINALHRHSDVGIVMLTQDDAESATAREELNALGVDSDKVEFRAIPHMDIWMRDMGPNFLRHKNGKGLMVADYGFNTWGYESPESEGSQMDGAVDREVAAQVNADVIRTSVISEGGNREFDETGTLMLTEAVEVQRNMNNPAIWPNGQIPKNLTVAQLKQKLEAEYRRTLGVRKVIWVPRGVPEDDLTFDGPKGTPDNLYYTLITTGGHIDEFARFAPNNTILLGEITQEEIHEETNPSFKEILTDGRARLEEAYAVLKNATNADGVPYRIVRVPMPPLMEVVMKPGDGVFDYLAANEMPYAHGPRITPDMPEFKGLLAASYLNYFVSNGVVLFQTYEREYDSPEYAAIAERGRKAERLALERIQAAYPGRAIAKIHPKAVNVGGGGVHCITQQEPRL